MHTDPECLFCNIVSGAIPSTKVYEDEQCLAFLDVNPLAPKHFLVVPKNHLASAAEISPENEGDIGHIFSVIARLAAEQGLESYRVVTNCGADAGQTVQHLHFHVLGGRELGSFN